jgi:RimJ/RimL family protein N-acetyltransferase
VQQADAAFIFELRAKSGRFLNRGASSEREQRDWIERYLVRPGDYYFVVERNSDSRADGVVGIYDLDADKGTAEWGRFILRTDSHAAVETALLVYRCAFDLLGLDRIYCRTLTQNAKVVAFHDSCGLARADRSVTLLHDGQPSDAVEHSLRRAEWPVVQVRLDRLAARLAARLQGSGSGQG